MLLQVTIIYIILLLIEICRNCNTCVVERTREYIAVEKQIRLKSKRYYQSCLN